MAARTLAVAVAFPADGARYWRNLLADGGAEALGYRFVECPSTAALVEAAPDIVVGQSSPFLLDYLRTAPPTLRWMQIMSTGVEDILDTVGPTPAFTLTNVSGIHREAMREYILAVMLHFAKDVSRWQRQQHAREWRPDRLSLLQGSRLLVVGTGEIGTAAAEICKALGMEVVGVSRTGAAKPPYDEIVDASQLLDAARNADFVLASVPLTSATRGLFDASFFEAIKPGSVFINISRGALVDDAALVSALETGQLAGAALDVFQTEPLPATSEFWGLPNVLVTPHIAGRFPDNHQKGRDLFLANLARYASGEPLHCVVDPSAGY